MRALAAVLLALPLALAPAGAAECVPTTSDPEVDALGFYVDNDECVGVDPEADPTPYLVWGHYYVYPWTDALVTSCTFSLWTYEESNGIAGLQRGDEVHDDTCGGAIDSDTLAFF